MKLLVHPKVPDGFRVNDDKFNSSSYCAREGTYQLTYNLKTNRI